MQDCEAIFRISSLQILSISDQCVQTPIPSYVGLKGHLEKQYGGNLTSPGHLANKACHCLINPLHDMASPLLLTTHPMFLSSEAYPRVARFELKFSCVVCLCFALFTHDFL